MKNALAIVAVASCVVPLCRAASPPPVPESLLACHKLQDEGKRLHCYDAQIETMIGAAASASVPAKPAPAAATAAVAATATAAPTAPAAPRSAPSPMTPSAARFGEETLPPTARPNTQTQEETALLSSIAALRKASSGTYTFSLANGQVWRQEESSQVAQFFRIGDDVRIEKAALGSYHMSTSRTGSKNWVRVTRVQ